MTVSAPRIGATATIAIVIAGNLLMGATIDRYGLFGLDEIPLTWPRVLGILLLATGAALSLHRT
jgi:transporter family-2 protein